MSTFIENEYFENKSFTENDLEKGDYEMCAFKGCDFSNADLSTIKFIECEFSDTNLSNANLEQTSFQDVAFNDCKMLGLRFEVCNDFNLSMQFKNCQLNHSSFFQMKLGRCSFTACQMEEVDLVEADLRNVTLSDCELNYAMFANTILEGANLKGSSGYDIDPESNYISGATFSAPEVLRLLNKYQIKIDQ